MTLCLTVEAVISINLDVLCDDQIHGLIDAGKLMGALGRPNQTYLGEVLYPTPIQRAAVLLDGICQAHAFIDGNKRTAWASVNSYLETQRILLEPKPNELPGELVLALVNKEIDVQFVTLWMAERMRQT